MMPNLRGLFLLMILVAASAVFGSRIRDDLQRPPEMPEPSASGSETPDRDIEIPELPGYDPPPIERFAAALDRPLFSADRRPPPDGQPTAAVVEDRSLSATLQGILFAGSGSVALLTAVGESAPVRVSQGEVFLGWKLLEIHPDNVVFGRDDETVTLELIYKVQPAPEQTAPQRQ